MPEFILNEPTSDTHPYYKLDEFCKGYIEAMFFTNGDTGDEQENLLNDVGVERLTKKSIKNIKSYCNSFLFTPIGNMTVASLVPRLRSKKTGQAYSFREAGGDLWFTAQRHGVGYWDRGFGDIGHMLTKAATALGEKNPYYQRGWIYFE